MTAKRDVKEGCVWKRAIASHEHAPVCEEGPLPQDAGSHSKNPASEHDQQNSSEDIESSSQCESEKPAKFPDVVVEYVKENYFPMKPARTYHKRSKFRITTPQGKGYAKTKTMQLRRVKVINHMTGTTKWRMKDPREVTNLRVRHWKKELLEKRETCCTILGCMRRFTSLAGIRNHYTWCAGRRSDGHRCDICHATFSTLDVLQRHSDSCRQKFSQCMGVTCDRCGAVFASHRTLHVHALRCGSTKYKDQRDLIETEGQEASKSGGEEISDMEAEEELHGDSCEDTVLHYTEESNMDSDLATDGDEARCDHDTGNQPTQDEADQARQDLGKELELGLKKIKLNLKRKRTGSRDRWSISKRSCQQRTSADSVGKDEDMATEDDSGKQTLTHHRLSPMEGGPTRQAKASSIAQSPVRISRSGRTIKNTWKVDEAMAEHYRQVKVTPGLHGRPRTKSRKSSIHCLPDDSILNELDAFEGRYMHSGVNKKNKNNTDGKYRKSSKIQPNAIEAITNCEKVGFEESIPEMGVNDAVIEDKTDAAGHGRGKELDTDSDPDQSPRKLDVLGIELPTAASKAVPLRTNQGSQEKEACVDLPGGELESTPQHERTCRVCEAVQPTKSSLTHHMAREHQLVISKEHPEGIFDPKQLIKLVGRLLCPKCGKEMRFLHYYTYHIKWCGRENEKEKCAICESEVRVMYVTQHQRMHNKAELRRVQEEERRKKRQQQQQLLHQPPPAGRVKRQAATK